MLISSKSNEKIKFIKNLNEKKYRILNNAYYLEGLKVVYEVLNKYKKEYVLYLVYSKELVQKIKDENNYFEKILDFCNKNKIEIIETSSDIFAYITDTITPQGIMCVLKKEEKNLEKELTNNKDKSIFILDNVQDMGNLGTIIRNASAFDIKNIICLDGTADSYSPKVLRSTMGNILNVNIFYENFEKIYEILKNNNFKIIGTSIYDSKSLNEFEFKGKMAFIFGNESNGIKKEILEKCDEKIRIDMSRNTESLNVSVASGIIGYLSFNNK